MTSRSGTSPPANSPSGLAALANGAVLSPFTQLRRLLGTTPAGHAEPIDLTIGEPREAMPAFVTEKLLGAASSNLCVVGPALRCIRGTGPRPRSFADKWLARGPFSGRAPGCRAQASTRPTGDPDVQSLLQRLHRRRVGS